MQPTEETALTRETIEELTTTFDRLWPLLRSITGDGARKTHDILGELLPLERHEIPSGAEVFDWTVPKEWTVNEAYLEGSDGRRVLDIVDNNLHLLNCSAPYRGVVSRADLDGHLFSLPELPEAVPYVTSYYEERWGFCLSQCQRDALPDGDYRVVIDSEFVEGSMTLSEALLPGETDEEVLLSTYTCHPSMANNELSGPLVAAYLFRRLVAWPRRRLTYRFVFVPETIGALAFLNLRGDWLRENLVAGFVLSCLAGDMPFVYKRSRRENSPADRAAALCLERHGPPDSRTRRFSPASFSSDERQYCSPGFDLPVGLLARGEIGEWPEYHTSLDNKEFISFERLQESIDMAERFCRVLDSNRRYRNVLPHGEPQLGKRGLYPTVGATKEKQALKDATVWILNQADGNNDLLAIAERSGMDFDLLAERAEACLEAGLLAVEDERP